MFLLHEKDTLVKSSFVEIQMKKEYIQTHAYTHILYTELFIYLNHCPFYVHVLFMWCGLFII